MSLFYPTSSFFSPLPPHTFSHPTSTPYLLLLILLLLHRETLNKVHHALLHTDLQNELVPSVFGGYLPPIVYLEGRPSSYVGGAIGVDLEGLVCSSYRVNSSGKGMLIIVYNS